MGFKATPKKIRIEGTQETGTADADGNRLEAVLSCPSLDEFAHIAAIRDATTSQQLDAFVELLAVHLEAWNATDDDDVPLPPTVDGLRAVDPMVVFFMAADWMTQVTRVSVPLGRRLSGGGTSLELSIPMAPLSPSPES